MTAASSTLLFEDPFKQFAYWFELAKKDPQLDMPEAMCLSTINARGRPSARMVLLKDADRKGFTFFTNVHSPKAKDLSVRPYAALTFHWISQRRQVRIEGRVSRVSKKVADAYFKTRPRLSQIGSWASRQSEPLKSREALLEEFDALFLKYDGKEIPAAPHWHGFCVSPDRVEFWQERPNRLHDRWVFTRGVKGRWRIARLYP